MIKTGFSGQTARVRRQLRFKPEVSRRRASRKEKEGSKSPKLGKQDQEEKASRLGLREGGRAG